MRKLMIVLLCGIWLTALGCGEEDGSGALELTTYGEDFIEQEIPAAAGADDEGFVDGWTVRYTRFLITIGDIEIADHNDEIGAEDSTMRVFDMHLAGPHPLVGFDDLGAQRWDRVSVTIAPADAATEVGNATADDLALMVDNSWSVYVEGEATRDDETYSFAWGFDTATTYADCHHDDFGEGVVVPDGGTETAQVTIHGDHLFYDDLQSPDTVLRFDAMAAADDGDGDITLNELSAVDLTTLTEGTYGTGGAGTVEDLGAFVTALTRTLVHWRGEGHCHSSNH